MNRLANLKFGITEVVIITGILAFAAVIYLVNLNQIQLNIDEVSPGYNAYSLLQTGKDEFGKKFPISFRFGGTYSPPLYIYLTVPMIAFFGLNIAAVRMVSALSAIGSVLVLYFILKNLKILESKFVLYFGLLVFTITPWLVIYGRSGYEAALPFLFFEIATLLTWIGLKKPKYLMIAIIVWSLSIYSSYTNKILAPLSILGIMVFFRDIVFHNSYRKFLLIGVILALAIQIPNLFLIFTKSFIVKSSISFSENILYQYSQSNFLLPGFIVLPYLYVREFFSQYLTYFSLRSLFWDGDPLLFRSIPGLSVFYSWLSIPYLVGLFQLCKNYSKLNYKFILFITIVSPIPAAFTKDPFWTYRAIPLLLPMIIIIIIGINKLISFRIPFLKSLCLVLFCISAIYLWQGFFVLLPYERAKDWQYGYSQLVKEITSRPNEFFVINNSSNGSTYLELAFFLKLDPRVLQNSVDQSIKDDYYNRLDFNPNYSFLNIRTGNVPWHDTHKKLVLVGDELSFSDNQIREHFLEKVFEIRYPSGNIAFVGYRTHPDRKCITDWQRTKLIIEECTQYIK